MAVEVFDGMKAVVNTDDGRYFSREFPAEPLGEAASSPVIAGGSMGAEPASTPWSLRP